MHRRRLDHRARWRGAYSGAHASTSKAHDAHRLQTHFKRDANQERAEFGLAVGQDALFISIDGRRAGHTWASDDHWRKIEHGRGAWSCHGHSVDPARVL